MEGAISLLASGVYQMDRKGGRIGEDRKNASMSHITYKKQGGGISIVQKARRWYLNNGKCIKLFSFETPVIFAMDPGRRAVNLSWRRWR